MPFAGKTNADGIGYISAGSTLDGTVFEQGTKYMADTIPGFVAGKLAAENSAWKQGDADTLTSAKAYSDAGKWYRRALLSTDHLDNLTEQGLYLINNSARAAEVGAPITTLSAVEHRAPNASYAHQIIYALGNPGQRLERWKGAYSGGVYTWGPWKRVDDVTARGLASRLLVEDFTRRHGTVNTGGIGAVALRFDHGLGNFNTIIRPLLEARGIPYSLALNSRNWGLAENGGVTATDVNTWVQGGLAEVWNHGAHHSNATSDAELRDTIVAGLTELRSQIPNAVIDGFAIPGVGTPGYGGFNGGATAASFYGTTAGRMILENHAVTSGYFSGTAHRAMDGTIRQGQGHYTMDSASQSAIQGQIDTAITNKTGLQLMLHPSNVNGSGNITTATLAAVLDYIVAKRDAGQLAVLSPYKLMVADSRVVNPRDTGWRKLTNGTNVNAGNIFMRRRGNDVHIEMQGVSFSLAGHQNTAAIPVGFQPQSFSGANWRNGAAMDDAGTSIRPFSYFSGNMRILNAETGKQYGGYITYITSDAWPTALPGTAA